MVKPLPRYGNLSIFKKGEVRHREYFKTGNFNCMLRVKLHHCENFCGDHSNRCWDIAVYWFQHDRFVIYVWTTHEDYFEVFFILQNSIGNSAVGLIICQFRCDVLWVWNSKKRILMQKDVRWCRDCQKRFTAAICVLQEETKKTKETLQWQTGYSMWGQNLPSPVDMPVGLYNSLYYHTSRNFGHSDIWYIKMT